MKNEERQKQLSDSEREELQNIIGLGRFSARKNYYPELQRKIEEIKREKDKFKRIFSGALSGIFQADLLGNIIIANSAMISLCGYESEEQLTSLGDIGTNLFVDSTEKDELIKRLETDGSIMRFETRFKKGDGATIDVLLNASIRHSQNGEYLECFVQDISEQKRVEAERIRLEAIVRQTEKMDAIGQLAGGISHDFNNMLGGIMGAAELLGQHVGNNETAIELQQMIITAAEQASDLTSKLLAFTRKQSIGNIELNVHDILDGTVAMLKSTIDRRIHINTDFAAEKSIVHGDPSQLTSVFLNLGINASHAMPAGGTIAIKTRTLELDQSYCSSSLFDVEPGSYLEVKVYDTGCGIPADDLKRVFEPFFTTKEPGKGTGLGLAAAYNTVVQVHGAITVESKLGVGTCFHILIPLCDEQTLSKTASDTVVLGQGKVLIIDDEAIMRTTARALLEELGYEVGLAENGHQGLEIFRNSPEAFDLVLLDMIMPVMNGRDCFAEMKKIKADVCVVVSTGYAREKDLEAMMSMGLSGYICKPFGRASLSQVVHDALRRRPPPCACAST